MDKTTKIVIPMAGAGSRFKEAGYSFPKPLIDINGKPMIQLVIENLKPKKHDYRFILICQKEHYDQYSLNNIFDNIIPGKYDCVQLTSMTQGAACTVLTATDLINDNNDLIIANSDQLVDIDIDDFIDFSRHDNTLGTIMTFVSNHPKWSYVRLDNQGYALEMAEKKPISDQATVGIYYFSEGKKFVEAATSMIEKDIRVNNEFYVCPCYNELLLQNGKVNVWQIQNNQMHGLGTPEDLNIYLDSLPK